MADNGRKQDKESDYRGMIPGFMPPAQPIVYDHYKSYADTADPRQNDAQAEFRSGVGRRLREAFAPHAEGQGAVPEVATHNGRTTYTARNPEVTSDGPAAVRDVKVGRTNVDLGNGRYRTGASAEVGDGDKISVGVRGNGDRVNPSVGYRGDDNDVKVSGSARGGSGVYKDNDSDTTYKVKANRRGDITPTVSHKGDDESFKVTRNRDGSLGGRARWEDDENGVGVSARANRRGEITPTISHKGEDDSFKVSPTRDGNVYGNGKVEVTDDVDASVKVGRNGRGSAKIGDDDWGVGLKTDRDGDINLNKITIGGFKLKL